MEIDFTTAFESWDFVYTNKQSKIHSGIYVIFNNITKKFYIGSSYNIKNRLYCHFFKLKSNKHPNVHLQRSYNKHDKSVWSIGIIEFCNENILIEKEQYYLNLYKSFKDTIGYNISPTASSIRGLKMSQETKDKMSKAQKGKKKNNFRNKEVYKFVHKNGTIEELSAYELTIKYNLRGGNVGKLVSNKVNQVKGWYLNNIKPFIPANKLNINKEALLKEYENIHTFADTIKLCKKYKCSSISLRNYVIQANKVLKDFSKDRNKYRNYCFNCKKSKGTFKFCEDLFICTNCII